MVYSAKKKERVERLRDKILIRYTDNESVNYSGGEISEFAPDTIEIEGETNYQFNEVKLNIRQTRAAKIAAIIEDKYSVDDQIATLANQNDNDTQHQEEVAEFQRFRAFAKKLVDEKV